MTTKIVCRLLDAQNTLLGWTEHYAAVRGDGALWSTGLVTITIEQEGVPACVSLHWCEMNVETRVPCPIVQVVLHKVMQVFEANVPMLRLGNPPVGLPPVTVGSPIRVEVPSGQLGNVGNA